jgi:Protein kinase domain
MSKGGVSFPLTDIPFNLEPLDGADPDALLGRDGPRQRVINYLLEHKTGRFLISGYSGVGKTSLVRRILYELQAVLTQPDERGRKTDLVVIELRAQALTGADVISKRLIWHLRWLVEASELDLSKSHHTRLLEAYQGVATSAVEETVGSKRSIKPSIGITAPLKLGLGGEQSVEETRKAVYLPYDIQSTLLELGQLISSITAVPRLSRVPLLRRLFTTSPARTPPMVVVVIDRIEDWEVMASLANLFRAPNSIFLVIVPPQVRAKWQTRRQAGHEDLPPFLDIYLTCLWDELPQLLERHIDLPVASPEALALFPKLTRYLTLMSTGIPSRCVELLEQQVEDRDGVRAVRFDDKAVATIEFYSDLQAVLEQSEDKMLGSPLGAMAASDQDRCRRFVLTVARDIVARGSVPSQNPMSALGKIASAIRPRDHEAIVNRLLLVLLEAGIFVPSGKMLTLSAQARQEVAQGREVMGTGVLPRFAEDPVIESASELTRTMMASAPPPPAASLPADRTIFPTESSPPTQATMLTRRWSGPYGGPERLESYLRTALHGEFEIRGLIGTGGMGTVYLADDIALARKVAIKVMAPGMVDQEFVERFKREARVMASLSHPNIVPIYSVRDTAGLMFFVMRYVDGRSLGHLIGRDKRLTPAMATEVVSQVGQGLAYAHRRGIVHRDIKPANILIDREGMALITDFGISKVTEAENQTRTGAVIGTPAYMSPEQCAGKEITGASDQYSLGVLTYEALTGIPPFRGDSAMAIMFEHFHATPEPIRQRQPEVPEQLESAVMRMLAKDPKDRWPNMEEAIAAVIGSTAQPRKRLSGELGAMVG